MKNEIKPNPSGKVTGINFIAGILFLVIFLGVNGFLYFDGIKSFVSEVKEAFESAYDNEYYESEEHTYLNDLHEYLEDMDLEYDNLNKLYENDSVGKLSVNEYNYTFEYKYGYLDFKLENSYVTSESFYISSDEYALLEMDNGVILVEYSTKGSMNTYHFLDKYLTERLELTASTAYEPVIADDGYIYFSGANEDDELAIYQYNTNTHKFIEMD